jgi:hypothetical protein
VRASVKMLLLFVILRSSSSFTLPSCYYYQQPRQEHAEPMVRQLRRPVQSSQCGSHSGPIHLWSGLLVGSGRSGGRAGGSETPPRRSEAQVLSSVSHIQAVSQPGLSESADVVHNIIPCGTIPPRAAKNATPCACKGKKVVSSNLTDPSSCPLASWNTTIPGPEKELEAWIRRTLSRPLQLEGHLAKIHF